MDVLSHVKNSATAQFFGLLCNWALYGTLVAQAYSYHISYPKDKLVYKIVVYFVFLLENVQTAVLTYGVYDSLITHFGDPIAIDRVQLAWLGIPLLSGLAGFIAHMVYTYRIYKLSRSVVVSGLVAVIALLQLATATVEAVHAHASQFFSRLDGSLAILVTWSFSSAVCDILIAGLMTYYLLKCDPGLKRTAAVVTKLVRLSVETGTITAAMATLNAVLFVSLPGNEAFNIPAFILPKLYSNTLLRLLNSRIYIKKHCTETISTVKFSSSSKFPRYSMPNEPESDLEWEIADKEPDLRPTFAPAFSTPQSNVHVECETTTFSDGGPPSAYPRVMS